MAAPAHSKNYGLTIRLPGMPHGISRDIFLFDTPTPVTTLSWMALQNIGKTVETVQLGQVLVGESAEWEEEPMLASDPRLRGHWQLLPGELVYVDQTVYPPIRNHLWNFPDFRHYFLTWGKGAGRVAWTVFG